MLQKPEKGAYDRLLRGASMIWYRSFLCGIIILGFLFLLPMMTAIALLVAQQNSR